MPKNSTPTITIYSTATCGYCKMLMSYLQSKAVKYETKRVDEDQSLAKELYEMTGQLGVPFTIIEKEGEKPVGVLGFDRPMINQALGIA